MVCQRSKPPLLPVSICGADIEVMPAYQYLGVHLDNKDARRVDKLVLKTCDCNEVGLTRGGGGKMELLSYYEDCLILVLVDPLFIFLCKGPEELIWY